MSSIRETLAQIRASVPAERKPVRANSTGEARAIKERWNLIDAVRTISQRLNFVAQAIDERDAKAPAFAKAVKQSAAKAARDHAADMFGEAAKVLAAFEARKAELAAEWGTTAGEANVMRNAALASANTAYSARLEFAHASCKESYRKYWASSSVANPRPRPVYATFYPKVEARRDRRCEIAKLRYDSAVAAADEDYAEVIDEADALYDMQLEAAEFLLWMQMRAIKEGEALPTAENCPGLVIADEDGNLSCPPDPVGERLFAQWQAERYPAESEV